MDSTKIVRVYGKHRLRVPGDWVPTWTDTTTVLMVPLGWWRTVELPLDRMVETWFLVAEDEKALDWVVSPEEVLQAREYDDRARELAEMIRLVKVDGRNQGGWELIMPKLEREFGWLPSAGGRAVLRAEQQGLSLWSETAFRIHRSELARTWRSSGRDVR